MASSDYPMGSQSPVQDTMYPDIDESVQYPWQTRQQVITGDAATSLIDPRLYGGLPPQGDIPGVPGEDYTDEENDLRSDLDDDAEMMPNEAPTSDEDSEYRYSDGQSERYVFWLMRERSRADNGCSDEEFSEEYPEEDASDDSGASRRRRGRRGGRFSGRYGARGGKGIKRGPRKPLEPSPEFKLLHSEATSAFIDGNYDRAIDLVMRAIQVNPEMFPAHSLLSEIFLAQGEKDKALAALWNGAHTRPKDPKVWLQVARLILERAGTDRASALPDVIYCYSRVIDIDPKNFNTRYQRAAIYRELGHNGRAATEYERILKEKPYSARALRHLASIYIDLEDVPRAIQIWAESIDYFQDHPEKMRDFSWSDINIYAELFGYVGKHEEGLAALKSLSRWFLGRKDDAMWDDFEEDDREWDPDDSPRRIKTSGFVPGQWPWETYGLGLPLELRVKMGLFRLKMGDTYHQEALHHFEWLNPNDTSEGARIFDYGDLFREVADALKDAGLPNEAYRFYAPIQQTTEYADLGYFMAMGDCCVQLEKMAEAETCYLTVAENDSRNMECRVKLGTLYEGFEMHEEGFKYINEAILIGRQEGRTRRSRRHDNRLEQLAIEFQRAPEPGTPQPADGLTASRTRPKPGTGSRTDDILFLYEKMKELHPLIKKGDSDVVEDWLDIADALLRDFRTNRVFYPIARTMEFQGYSGDGHRKKKSKQRTLLEEALEIAARLQKALGNGIADESLSDAIPSDYHGIPFDEWLDIFLEYALLSTEQGEAEEAYEALDGAANASVWFHSKINSRLIHVCWFTCALRAQDEEALASEARWFLKEYQFVTDTYRLFGILSNLAGDPQKSLFHSSPNMKFMLRQIKAMDFTLPDESNKPQPRQTIWKERATLSTKDEFGEPIPATEMDIVLLVLYGHILYSGGSFFPALNYLYRAYALDDQNPAVLLSIGLCYIHHSLKRQSDNRHYFIMQGLAFMDEYRRVRAKPGSSLQERQEMEFNFARVYHGLGLVHLAVTGYEKVLDLGGQIREQKKLKTGSMSGADDNNIDIVEAGLGDQVEKPSRFAEDFSFEAAYSLQIIHVLSGDAKTAKDITDQWLVI
ncbi:hypothetical protein N7532_010815 [Penicillium argentinense]|uniref:Uncharacterized protein n=1 Tax=Penicillium argentinense TaxID=1131581 RepID=A0A9W9EQH4_9EURO|nr:uncharacterized protein N7532_010815 [Penicillium argentinense]KAJ5086044.1 hypothetical protein N7532_010815 [Penicillium argentinense]